MAREFLPSWIATAAPRFRAWYEDLSLVARTTRTAEPSGYDPLSELSATTISSPGSSSIRASERASLSASLPSPANRTITLTAGRVTSRVRLGARRDAIGVEDAFDVPEA